MYPESTTDSPARLSLRQTGSPGMIYSARYGSPKRQLQFYRYPSTRCLTLSHHCTSCLSFLSVECVATVQNAPEFSANHE
ncbi:hypothetical protein MATL_G00113420 [Megalops atlanticus]|uniref:Uncharacterized protein n=1 Tax=Megalops atlanticus TaxID=7932 RepID=A0A9D3Q188_MEGAT|nr:hypothetical protein MATL_G00113420 [Megalops atlanticus]